MSRQTKSSKRASQVPRGAGRWGAETSPGADKAQNGLKAGLYVTATPIGNARDISLRALSVLENCDVIAAEDTRVTAKLLAIHGISKPLLAYNDHSAARERPRLVARLRDGARVALVSDAGTPLLSDPGYKLVREALQNDIPVEAVPGASALLTALVLSGLPPDRFFFAGFLPSRTAERRSVLSDLKLVPATLVFFESPNRIAESLADMSNVLGARLAAIGRELTKFHEEVRRGELAVLAAEFASQPPPRGEITIVVGPPGATKPDDARVDSLLGRALEFMPVRAATDLVADAIDAPRRAVYERALKLKSGANG